MQDELIPVNISDYIIEAKRGPHPVFPGAFLMTVEFRNGYTASIITGQGCYGTIGKSYELAVLGKDGEFVRILEDQSDDVIPYINQETVMRHLQTVATLPPHRTLLLN